MQQELLRIIHWIAAQEQAMALFVLAYALATVVGLPGSPFTLGAAILFGFWKGLAVALLGANLGAAAAFLCTRYLGRNWVAGRLKNRVSLAKVDEAVQRSGWRVVLLMRLAPVFPFNVLNYALGLTGISFGQYFLATALGIIPGAAAYVYVGTLIGDLAQIGEARTDRTTVEWAVYAVGLLATAAALVYIVRLAKKELQKTDSSAAQDQPG